MLNKHFQLEDRQTSVKIELVAGLTTFLTMAYVIFVNPAILSETGMDKGALIAVTCIVTAAATIITGLFANAPIAMAPGMGLNSFFAVLVISGKMNWQTANELADRVGGGVHLGRNLFDIDFVGTEKKNCRSDTAISCLSYRRWHRSLYYLYRPEKSRCYRKRRNHVCLS
jgi:hypothetical protein